MRSQFSLKFKYLGFCSFVPTSGGFTQGKVKLMLQKKSNIRHYFLNAKGKKSKTRLKAPFAQSPGSCVRKDDLDTPIIPNFMLRPVIVFH